MTLLTKYTYTKNMSQVSFIRTSAETNSRNVIHLGSYAHLDDPEVADYVNVAKLSGCHLTTSPSLFLLALRHIPPLLLFYLTICT
jgi:hypothetical protein